MSGYHSPYPSERQIAAQRKVKSFQQRLRIAIQRHDQAVTQFRSEYARLGERTKSVRMAIVKGELPYQSEVVFTLAGDKTVIKIESDMMCCNGPWAAVTRASVATMVTSVVSEMAQTRILGLLRSGGDPFDLIQEPPASGRR